MSLLSPFLAPILDSISFIIWFFTFVCLDTPHKSKRERTVERSFLTLSGDTVSLYQDLLFSPFQKSQQQQQQQQQPKHFELLLSDYNQHLSIHPSINRKKKITEFSS
jgi:hypothetical protein